MASIYQNVDLTQLFDASVQQETIKDIYTVSKEIIDVISKNYLDAGMSTQGKLANFDSIISYQGNIYQLQLKLPREWYWVEYGRRPGPVSKEGIESIKHWIQIKKIVPQGRNGKKPPTTKGLAYAIAKKIQLEGFYSPGHHGKHILEKSMNEAEPLIQKLCNIITEKINASVNKDVVTLFDGLQSFTVK